MSYTSTLFPSGAVNTINTVATVPASLVALLTGPVVGLPGASSKAFYITINFDGPLGPNQSFQLGIQPSFFPLFSKGYRHFVDGKSIDPILLSQTTGPLSINITLSPVFLTTLFDLISSYLYGSEASSFSGPILITYLTEVVSLGNIGQSNGSPTNPGNDG